MTEYHMYGVNLSKPQIEKIDLRAKKHRAIKVR